jgi:hypothetical protein
MNEIEGFAPEDVLAGCVVGAPRSLSERVQQNIGRNFRERRWEPAELNGGEIL